jgi:hypothetical protein
MKNSANRKSFGDKGKHSVQGNQLPGRVVFLSKGRQHDKQSDNCISTVAEITGICSNGNSDAGAGDWRERGGF